MDVHLAARLRTSCIRLSPSVVTRPFPRETIVLHLGTGRYHALNAVAGAMLSALARTGSFSATAREIADEYERPLEEVERDLGELCAGLLDRGLIDLDGA